MQINDEQEFWLDQSEAKIVFATAVNPSFQVVNLRFSLAFTALVNWSNVDFFVTFATRRKYVVNDIVFTIFASNVITVQI